MHRILLTAFALSVILGLPTEADPPPDHYDEIMAETDDEIGISIDASIRSGFLAEQWMLNCASMRSIEGILYRLVQERNFNTEDFACRALAMIRTPKAMELTKKMLEEIIAVEDGVWARTLKDNTEGSFVRRLEGLSVGLSVNSSAEAVALMEHALRASKHWQTRFSIGNYLCRFRAPAALVLAQSLLADQEFMSLPCPVDQPDAHDIMRTVLVKACDYIRTPTPGWAEKRIKEEQLYKNAEEVIRRHSGSKGSDPNPHDEIHKSEPPVNEPSNGPPRNEPSASNGPKSSSGHAASEAPSSAGADRQQGTAPIIVISVAATVLALFVIFSFWARSRGRH